MKQIEFGEKVRAFFSQGQSKLSLITSCLESKVWLCLHTLGYNAPAVETYSLQGLLGVKVLLDSGTVNIVCLDTVTIIHWWTWL